MISWLQANWKDVLSIIGGVVTVASIIVKVAKVLEFQLQHQPFQ